MYSAEELVKANEKLKTCDIKGKAYVQVNNRIQAFRELLPDGCIETKLLSVDNGVCIFQALIYDENGKLLATGTAYEKEDSTFINKTSYIENCETSAVGRALGMLGIGIDASVCSAEELVNAVTNQGNYNAPDRASLMKQINKKLEPLDNAQEVFDGLKKKFDFETLSSASVETLLKVNKELG